ncbi:hypothetical protein LEP1GSC202_0110 [Leptospira yanagawae serovar Saopaulo str. Sao Paulo = ATCC 700523]|uniref:Uncharacterized protein n=1 Tax=Leptospira yanagawae serovar Saopaulo str. Sao Paulo = ATCC 700523 TaxID=1249483 RepID=A0A5E8H6G2_9LEPT|nr:hypothetical protein [Leptospira yanagawae]EOQ86885.1 hypothetical protein LEP1GSC202_0110 [Leptospira yanagawae serovar Saopaulo str. Sao Paulo = ATCC 700523]
MKHLKNLISKWKESKSKRETAYFGTSLYDELFSNPIPSILLVIGAFSFFYFSFPYIHYLGHFFYWFVGVLEITKVLKIPFLDEVRYYHYLSVFVYFYISISLLIDISKLLNHWNKRTVFVKGELWQIRNFGLGKELSKFNLNEDGLVLTYEHGGLNDYLGWNRLIWKKQEKVIFSTPFFFPFRKNKMIVNQILKR